MGLFKVITTGLTSLEFQCYARRLKRRGHAKTAVLLDKVTSPVAIWGMFLGISNIVPKDLSMNSILRHVAQAMHEANELVPPPMHPMA